MSNDQKGSGKAAAPVSDGLSYELHTDRELELMLKGIKPLAWFSDMIFDDHDMREPDEDFECHVASGTFVKHEVREFWEPYSYNGHLVKGRWTRFYALKDEAWRIPAFQLLLKIQEKHAWDDALERLQGSLLGYTDEQNDEWLAKRHKRHAGWACVTLYATTTNDSLNEIIKLGQRALPREFLTSARLFLSDGIPTRPALEQACLLSSDACKLIRFGIETKFFLAHFLRTGASDPAPVSIRGEVKLKELNSALRTDVQIFDLV